MNNDKFLIENSDLEQARSICREIADPKIRNRAVANALAADVAKKYFEEVEVDIESGLHKIPFVLNRLDIADIYVKDSYIDVRVYFNDNELCVPKSHFDNNLLPIAYMFIKLDSELSNATVTGFILPDAVYTTTSVNGYYKIEEESLISYYDVDAQLVSSYSDDVPENFDIQIFNYLDGKLDNENEFYKILLNSRYCRVQLRNASNVKTIFNSISDIEVPVKQDLRQVDEADSTFDLIDADSSLEEFPMENSLDSVDLALDEDNEDTILESTADDSNDFELDGFEEQEFDLVESGELEEHNPEFSIEEESVILENDDSADLSIEIDDSNETSIPEFEPSSDDVMEEVAEEENILDLEPEYQEIEEEVVAENNMVLDSDVESATVDVLQIEEEVQVDSLDAIEDETAEEDARNYSTNVTPSIDAIEDEVSLDSLEEMLDTDNSVFDVPEEVAPVDSENSQQIDELFGGESENPEDAEGEIVVTNQKRGFNLVPLLALVLVGAIGYYGYTKFVNQNSTVADSADIAPSVVQQDENKVEPSPVQDAMPVESVENPVVPVSSNEGTAESIPAIEQNLDASILVSNLSVNWEVPAGYISNNTAKRYLTKVGKIIQLNLRADLLLLSKTPITNKVKVELEFNKSTSKFGVKNITASSGEKTVDEMIINTVNGVLDTNLKTNMSVFANISGNPVLIIRL